MCVESNINNFLITLEAQTSPYSLSSWKREEVIILMDVIKDFRMEGVEQKYCKLLSSHLTVTYLPSSFRSWVFSSLNMANQSTSHPVCLCSFRKHYWKESKKAYVWYLVTVLIACILSFSFCPNQRVLVTIRVWLKTETRWYMWCIRACEEAFPPLCVMTSHTRCSFCVKQIFAIVKKMKFQTFMSLNEEPVKMRHFIWWNQ